MSPNTAAGAFFSNTETFAQFSPRFSEAAKEGPGELPNGFSFPASWDYSGDGTANTGTGMKDNGGSEMPPVPTGMTPITMPGGTWQSMSALEGHEWMFSNWNAGTPQQ